MFEIRIQLLSWFHSHWKTLWINSFLIHSLCSFKWLLVFFSLTFLSLCVWFLKEIQFHFLFLVPVSNKNKKRRKILWQVFWQSFIIRTNEIIEKSSSTCNQFQLYVCVTNWWIVRASFVHSFSFVNLWLNSHSHSTTMVDHEFKFQLFFHFKLNFFPIQFRILEKILISFILINFLW